MVVLGQGGCIPAKLLYSVKKGCVREKVVVFGQKSLYCSKSGYIREKLLNSGKVVVFGKKWLHSGNVVVL